MKKQVIALLFIIFSICIRGSIYPCVNINASEQLPLNNDSSKIHVAVYNGSGAWYPSSLGLEKMFTWMGCNVTLVHGEDIINGCLANFDILAWPGGNYVAYWEVGQEGKKEIQEFVSGGGGYIGICAGAYWACDYMVWMRDSNFPPPDYKVEGDEENLDLFPGVARGPIDEIMRWPKGNMTKIDIVNHTHPITDSLPDHMIILYWGGPHLLPYENADMTTLARYNVTGTPAIVACEYGNGRVFLCGPHAEIEEDSGRDGLPPDPNWSEEWTTVPRMKTEWSDEGSDWPLFLEAVKWLTKRSTYNQMQDLTDQLNYCEIQDLNDKVNDLESELMRTLIDLNNQLQEIEEEHRDLNEKISQIQNQMISPQIIYPILGVTIILAIIAIILNVNRR